MTIFKSPRILIALLAVALFFNSCGGTSAGRTTWSTKKALLQLLLDLNTGSDTPPGIVLGVVTPDGTWFGASGESDTATSQPITTSMQFRLASVTKTMTATLVMKLVDEGALAITDTVERWLPGLVNRGDEVTVLMLLNHTSGIYDYQVEDDSTFWDAVIADPTRNWTSTEILALINSHDFIFEPGTSFSYSNAGYYLLGMIMEAATGSTVENLASEKIFQPLGMTQTSLAKSGALSSPYTHGYAWLSSDNTINDVTDWNFSWDWTAGSGVSGVSDMMLFLRGLFGGDVVSAASLAQMETPISPATDYGFGMVVYEDSDFTGERTYTHAGDNPGTNTIWFYLPDSDRFIFMELNRSDATFDPSNPVPFDSTEKASEIFAEVMDILNG